MRLFTAVVLFFTLLSPIAFAKKASKKVPEQPKSCIAWPKVFEQEAVRRIPVTSELIGVSPFFDDTGVSGDEWLSQGLADLLLRYLSVDPNLGLLPARDAGLLPPERPIRYKVAGLFQHTQGWLRIFVQLMDNQGTLLAQFPVETPYPLHKHFFTGLRETAEGIFKKIGHKKIDTKKLKAIENETDNVQAYENVIKGKLALESYDPNKMEVALIWFQEARREDTHYPAAYRGMMETYGFLSLLNKNRELPYDIHLQGIESVLRATQKRTGKEGVIPNRFLQAHVHYVTGTRALAKGDGEKATAELEQAARLVPEDALTSYFLAEAYDKLGKTELAGLARNHAEEINSCLKGQ